MEKNYSECLNTIFEKSIREILRKLTSYDIEQLNGNRANLAGGVSLQFNIESGRLRGFSIQAPYTMSPTYYCEDNGERYFSPVLFTAVELDLGEDIALRVQYYGEEEFRNIPIDDACLLFDQITVLIDSAITEEAGRSSDVTKRVFNNQLSRILDRELDREVFKKNLISGLTEKGTCKIDFKNTGDIPPALQSLFYSGYVSSFETWLEKYVLTEVCEAGEKVFWTHNLEGEDRFPRRSSFSMVFSTDKSSVDFGDPVYEFTKK